MVGIVFGIICFIIWVIHESNQPTRDHTFSSSYNKTSHQQNKDTISTPSPSIPSAAIKAKDHNRKLLQELEDHDSNLLQMAREKQRWERGLNKTAHLSHTTSRNKNSSATSPPPWFIGDWGIKEPSHAEQLIINELKKYRLKWYREVSFQNLVSPAGGFPRFDFYLPTHKTAIEYQGIGYHESQERVASDKLKAKYCKTNNITLHIYEVEHYRRMEETIADLMRSLKVRMK